MGNEHEDQLRRREKEAEARHKRQRSEQNRSKSQQNQTQSKGGPKTTAHASDRKSRGRQASTASTDTKDQGGNETQSDVCSYANGSPRVEAKEEVGCCCGVL